MSDKKTIDLSIFNPLGDYFKLLNNLCNTFDSDCINTKLSKIITTDCDDASGNIVTSHNTNKTSKNFAKALDLFALNLRSYDSPISAITIKGTLYEHFLDAYNKSTKSNSAFNYDVTLGSNDTFEFYTNTSVVNKPALIGEIVDQMTSNVKNILNMNDTYLDASATGIGIIPDTYKSKLIDAFNTTAFPNKITIKTLLDAIFEKWINDVYDVYGDAKESFKFFLEEIEKKWNDATNYLQEFEPSHINAFNTFFQIKSDLTSFDLKRFWTQLEKELSNKTFDIKNYENYRINIKVVSNYNQLMTAYVKPPIYTKNLKAGIVYAFPKSVQTEFNDKLSNKKTSSDIFNGYNESLNPKNFYKIKQKCLENPFKIDSNQVKELINFVNNRENVYSHKGEKWIEDYEDKSDYSDTTNPDFTIDDAEAEMSKYKNTWAKDLNGYMYTRLDENGKPNFKWMRYDEERSKNDIISFKTKDAGTTCGHLCIFETPSECEIFFNKMIKGDNFTYKELSKMLKNNSFNTNYSKLRENIVQVNPAFVIGTLKAFGFQKWEKLNNDGTKTIKIETFTRWWNRNGRKFMIDALDELAPGVSKKTNEELLKSNDPADFQIPNIKLHEHKNKDEMVVPQPPENLELFLKLLISFINMNEFVLNPQNKLIITSNKLPKSVLRPNPEAEQPDELEIIDSNGKVKKVKNDGKDYFKSKSENSGSLGEALDQIIKNSFFKPANPGSPENRHVFDILNKFGWGVNGLGKFMIGRFGKYPRMTGYGYKHDHNGNYNSKTNNVQFGGLTDEELEEFHNSSNKFRPCSKSAFEAYTLARKSLSLKNKKFNDDYDSNMYKKIIEMSKLEDELYIQLNLIGKYEKIINSISDIDDESNEITQDAMDDAVKNYESKAVLLSKKSDDYTSLIYKLMNNNVSFGSSKYVPI